MGYGHTAAALAALRERDDTQRSHHHSNNIDNINDNDDDHNHHSSSNHNNRGNNNDNNDHNNHDDHRHQQDEHEHTADLKGDGAETRARFSGGGYSGFEGGVWFGKESFPHSQANQQHNNNDNYSSSSSNSHLHGGGGGVSAAILSEGDNYDSYAMLQGLGQGQTSRQGPESANWNLSALEPIYNHPHQHHQHQQQHHNQHHHNQHHHQSNGQKMLYCCADTPSRHFINAPSPSISLRSLLITSNTHTIHPLSIPLITGGNNQRDTVVAALQASASMAMHNSALALQVLIEITHISSHLINTCCHVNTPYQYTLLNSYLFCLYPLHFAPFPTT